MRNLRVFRELCGSDYFKNVMLCASFWNTETEGVATLESRLAELTSKEGWWGGMIARGSKVFNETLTRAGAIKMIYELMAGSATPLQVQREVVDEHKTIKDTLACSTFLKLELERNDQEHYDTMESMKREFEQQKQRFRRAHSENLEQMRNEYEKKQAEIDENNRKLEEELNAAKAKFDNSKRIPHKPIQNKTEDEMSDQQTWPPKDPPKYSEINESPAQSPQMPNIHRATTFAADEISLFQEAVTKRHQRYTAFSQAVAATIRLLEKGKLEGTVKCEFSARRGCFLKVCVNCLKNVGGNGCFSKWHYSLYAGKH
jgi:hypothetical protein